jgi:hypothetical protein
MASSPHHPQFDSSSGAGVAPFTGNANFVIIDTPTPMPTELDSQIPPSNVITTSASPSAPVAATPSVSDKPVRIWTLKPRRWVLGLLGPLKEVAFIDERGVDRFSVEFSGAGFADHEAVITDLSNGGIKPFKYVDSTHFWTDYDMHVFAQDVAGKTQEVGKLVQVGCPCQGLWKIILGKDEYYMRMFNAMLSGYLVRTRFTTIFAKNMKPLLHWNENTSTVSIYTNLDVTLMMLILAQFSHHTFTLPAQLVMAKTTLELDTYTRVITHPSHGFDDPRDMGTHKCTKPIKFAVS